MASVERDRTSEKTDDRAPALIGQDLGVGQAGAVIDGDVDALPARGLAPDSEWVLASWPQAAGGRSGDRGAGAVLDPSQALDVDVDQLAGSLALLAHRGLEAEASELAHPDSRQDPRDGRERHVEDLGDLRAGNRNRLKAAIALTRCSLVRCGIRCGAEERSRNPSSPSAR